MLAIAADAIVKAAVLFIAMERFIRILIVAVPAILRPMELIQRQMRQIRQLMGQIRQVQPKNKPLKSILPSSW